MAIDLSTSKYSDVVKDMDDLPPATRQAYADEEAVRDDVEGAIESSAAAWLSGDATLMEAAMSLQCQMETIWESITGFPYDHPLNLGLQAMRGARWLVIQLGGPWTPITCQDWKDALLADPDWGAMPDEDNRAGFPPTSSLTARKALAGLGGKEGVRPTRSRKTTAKPSGLGALAVIGGILKALKAW